VGAYTAAGITDVPCDVRQGGLRDAILHSAGANADHGVRRSNADKRRAVLMLLRDEEWGRWNDSKVARACAVHHETVARIRSEYLAETQDSPRLVERGGTVYPMKPRASGPKVVDPAPIVPADLADALARQYRREAQAERSSDLKPGPATRAPAIDLTRKPAFEFRRAE
jgi:hypothetical protein